MKPFERLTHYLDQGDDPNIWAILEVLQAQEARLEKLEDEVEKLRRANLS